MSDLFRRIAEALSPNYRLIRQLGGGGAAHIFLAEDVARQRRVAIKVLREELTATISAERFLAEISVAAKLEHTNIVALYESGSVDGLPYYVMPLIPGESLRARLTRLGKFPIEAALEITAQIGCALDYAHEHRVLHRDIKPENVILGSAGAVVLDFGIALALDATKHRRTMPGVVPGTPEYMSPEQAAGDRDLDGRSDIYSLGCVTYEMICGSPPFVGLATIVIARQIAAPAKALDERCAGVPHIVARVLDRALAKLPNDRYSSAGAFVSALTDAWSASQSPLLKTARG
jgi:eukaryotic-like serine/threonine-protein kinase